MRLHKKPFNKYRSSIIATILLLMSIATLVWGVIPAIKNIQKTLRVVNVLRKETTALQKKLTFLDNLNEEEMRKNLVDLLLAAPFGRSIPTLLLTVLDVSSQAQVNLTDLGVDAPNPLATQSGESKPKRSRTIPAEIPVKVEIEGDEQRIRTFFDSIQKVRRIMGITDVNVAYDEAGQILARLTIEGYSLPMLVGGIASDSALLPFSDEEKALINRVAGLPTYGGDLPQVPVKPAQLKADPFKK